MSFRSPTGSGSLERKPSAIFDTKLQKQKKDESDQRANRERQQAEYASRHNVQELFALMAEAITADGPPRTESEANQRIFEFLVRRKQAKEQSKQRIRFMDTIQVDVKPQISMRMSVNVAGAEVQLWMKKVLSSQYTLDDVVAISWEQFSQWEDLLSQMAMHADDRQPADAASLLATIRSDGKVTGYVSSEGAAGKTVNKIGDKLWNLCMEFRQTSKRVGVFQPL